MKLTDILAKVAKGETLTDEEKAFAGGYNPQTDIDAAAAKARKKAETERDDFKAQLDKANEELEAAKGKAGGADDALAKLQRRLENLEKAKKDAETALAAKTRSETLHALAGKHGIRAAKGVSEDSLNLLVEHAFRDVDLGDEEAVKAAAEGFKTANGGLIDAGTIGGAGAKGTAGAAFAGPNPFAKDTFNLTRQMEIASESPERAAALSAAANK